MSTYDIQCHNIWAIRKFNRRSFQEWQQTQRNAEVEGGDLVKKMSEVLSPVMFFIAKGAKPTANGPRIGTLNMRAWTLLYALRPDLLGGETMKEAGERFGVTRVRMQQFLHELRIAVPDLVIDTASRRGHASDKRASSERKQRAAALRWQKREASRTKIRPSEGHSHLVTLSE